MGSTYCLRILVALFPACVTCLGNYGGSMPTADVQRISAHAFPVIGSEVKQMGNWNDPSYNSVYQYDFSSSQPSAQRGSHTVSTLPQRGSTLMRTLKVPESSYDVARTTGSDRTIVEKPLKNAYGQVDISSGVRYPLARGPNYGSTSVKNEMPHSLSQGSWSTNKVQTASSSYDPLLKGTAFSSMTYAEAKPSIVSSGPIFVVQGGENTKGHGVYSQLPESAKPNYVGPYQASQSFRDISLTASSQGKSWNEPLHYFVSGVQYSPIPEWRRSSESQYRNNIAKSTASSGETPLKAPESAQRNKLLPSSETTQSKFQQTYNTGGKPNQVFKPVYPYQSGLQQHVSKPLIASSGAILIMQAPTNVQSGTEFDKPKVLPNFPERKVTFASVPTVQQYQPFHGTQNSRIVQPSTSTYASSSQTWSQGLSSVKGMPYKPNSGPSKPSSGFCSNNPNIAGSNEINRVHVRLHRLRSSSFGNFQNQRASGDSSSGAFRGSSGYLGQRPSQNVQTPVVSSSAPQYHDSKSQYHWSRTNL